MDLGLGGATVAVTGGTKGMGRAIALCLAGEGAKVAVLARHQADIDETVEALLAAGAPEAMGVATDVTSGEQVSAAFAAIGARWGSLNVLVNTVGPGAAKFEDLSDDDWEAVFDISLMSAVRSVRPRSPLIRAAEWARIVNISAHSIQRQSPLLVAYTASKAALTSVSKNLAKSLAPEGILVNTVSPGSIVTASFSEGLRPMFDAENLDPTDPYDVMKWIETHFHQPADLGRAGLPIEIAVVVTFLAQRRQRLRHRGQCERRRRLGLHMSPAPALSAAELMGAAESETGLSDYGGESFRDGLERLTLALSEEAQLNDLGYEIMRIRLVGHLVSRLQVTATMAQHPDIAEQEIRSPLFIIGLPRTGTTALSNLLDADPAIRSLRCWESSSPVPPPEEATQDTDPRIEPTARGLEAMYETFPKMRSLHFQTATGPTECQDLLGMDMRTSHFDGMAIVPSYTRWVLDCDMTPAYVIHRRTLQLLQWHCPPYQWHLKTPVHMLSLPALVSVYPDARFIWTHRDPAEVMGSVCSLIEYTRSWVGDPGDPVDLGAEQLHMWAEAIRRAINSGPATVRSASPTCLSTCSMLIPSAPSKPPTPAWASSSTGPAATPSRPGRCSTRRAATAPMSTPWTTLASMPEP